MAAKRFLVTGALGCIGAWTVRTLVQAGVPTVAFDSSDDRHRIDLIGPLPHTPLREGVAATIALFRNRISRGVLPCDALLR